MCPERVSSAVKVILVESCISSSKIEALGFDFATGLEAESCSAKFTEEMTKSAAGYLSVGRSLVVVNSQGSSMPI